MEEETLGPTAEGRPRMRVGLLAKLCLLSAREGTTRVEARGEHGRLTGTGWPALGPQASIQHVCPAHQSKL